MSKSLGVFAKFWEPGKVKTRLASSIGEYNSAELYRHMLQTVVHRFDNIQAHKTLYFDPPDRLAEFEQLNCSWELMPQSEGGLEQRLGHFFRSKLEHHQKVVVVGSDCPQLLTDEIERAFILLDDDPMVIGPATDGGYYLLGLREPADFLFEDIKWSSEVVFQQTVARAAQNGISYSTLNENFDIDDWQSLLLFVQQYECCTEETELLELVGLARKYIHQRDSFSSH